MPWTAPPSGDCGSERQEGGANDRLRQLVIVLVWRRPRSNGVRDGRSALNEDSCQLY